MIKTVENHFNRKEWQKWKLHRHPMCGEILQWKLVDTSNKGFSHGKTAVGAVLLGPVGLLGGALGKEKQTYYCGKCGFHHEY